jgi:hypothetical protein
LSFRAVMSPRWANTKTALALVSFGGLLIAVAAQLSVASRRIPAPAWLVGLSPSGRTLFLVSAFVVSYVAEVAAIQLVAWILGGRGTFTELAFLVATYGTPVDVAGSLLGYAIGPSLLLLPITCLFPLYSFALRFVAVRAVHRLSAGASLVALIPGLFVSTCAALSTYLAAYPWANQIRELAA